MVRPLPLVAENEERGTSWVDRLLRSKIRRGERRCLRSPKAQIIRRQAECQRVEDNAFHLGYFARCCRFPTARRKRKFARAQFTDAVCSPPGTLVKMKSSP